MKWNTVGQLFQMEAFQCTFSKLFQIFIHPLDQLYSNGVLRTTPFELLSFEAPTCSQYEKCKAKQTAGFELLLLCWQS